MKDSLPCTACRYCTEHCPKGLDIPTLLAVYNDLKFAPSTNSAMIIEMGEADKQPSNCISCGKCTKMCPQKIDIPSAMKELNSMLDNIPKWRDICRMREEAAKLARVD